MTARQAQTDSQTTALRAADTVMRLDRMGAFFPTRLSFMRSLLRQLAAAGARSERRLWNIDPDGYGHAVYCVTVGDHCYSLIAYANRLAPEDRTDRVIAEAWDTAFVLFDGVPDAADIARIGANAPKQEAGRFAPTELVLSRANKSVRFFDHTVSALADGRQPDAEMLRNVGYLLRTTAVYGNGKFGIADREVIRTRPILSGPFQAEMLTVWLIRAFSHDLVDHIAACRAPQTAVRLDQSVRERIGIGNSTGLGMAPFLVNHPQLLNNWMLARETAFARCRDCSALDRDRVAQLVERVGKHLQEWNVPDPVQSDRIVALRSEFADITADGSWVGAPSPWDALYRRAERYGLECQELVVALALEANGPLVDDLAHGMDATEVARLDPSMTAQDLTGLLGTHARWALDPDFDRPENTAFFWYVSEEKQEPRLGLRHSEAGAELETPLDIARQIQRLAADLKNTAPETSLAAFLMAHPAHRGIVRRVQNLPSLPYAEIRDNLIGSDCRPIDMLRCKLSFFGASKFDPKSDRWTRITLFQGAPLPDRLAASDADDWWLPCVTL